MHTTSLMPSVMAVKNLDTLPRTALTRFLHQEYHTTMADPVQGTDTPTNGGTDYSPIMAQGIGDISEDHSTTSIPSTIEATLLKDISCSHSSHHSSSCCPSANGHSCYPLCQDTSRLSCTPSHTCHFPHRHHSHHST